MANFSYKVKNKNGYIEEGNIYTESLSEAAMILEQKGFVILEIKENVIQKQEIPQGEKFSSQEKMILTIQEKKEFFNSFYFLYRSGNSILQIFDSMSKSTRNIKIRMICARILKGVSKGHSLKDSMKFCNEILGQAYTMLVVAGEESGQLEYVLHNILENISMQQKVKNDIISKMTYPAIIFFFAIFVALLFKFFIIQIFVTSAAGETICMSSLILSALFKIIFIFALIGAVIFILYRNKKFLSDMIFKFSNWGPIGKMVENYTFANFFSILALSFQAGITASVSVQLARSVINLPNYKWKLKKAEDRVIQGCELTTALAATSLFSDYAISQVSAGEKSGELEKLLKTVADDYENKLKVSLDVALKFLEPLMIIFVGIVVLYVAVSAYKGYYGYIFSLM